MISNLEKSFSETKKNEGNFFAYFDWTEALPTAGKYIFVIHTSQSIKDVKKMVKQLSI